jgi:predicted hydrocarbon binding protein
VNGLIFIEVGKFAQARLGAAAWQRLARSAGVGHRVYVPVANYPDEELVGLLNVLSAETGEPVRALLEALGEFIVPDLMSLAQSVIQPAWKTLDLIANTEGAIHEVIRHTGSHSHPPHLRCRRLAENEVVVHYSSPRKLCPLARGIVKGVAAHYGETVSLAESSCMLRGDSACQIVVTLV